MYFNVSCMEIILITVNDNNSTDSCMFTVSTLKSIQSTEGLEALNPAQNFEYILNQGDSH